MDTPPHFLARLRGLREVNRLEKTGDLPGLLATAAEVVAEVLGYATVAVNLYRPAWDDFEVAVVHGSDEARATLLGDTSGWSFWSELLDERFHRRGAYFISEGQLDWSALRGRTHVPDLPTLGGPDAWHAEDALMVPLRASDGRLLGILSVDEPRSGKRPTAEEVDTLVAVAEHAAQAIENALETQEAERDRRSLEGLLRVTSRIAERRSAEAVLQEVCEGVRSALGFQLVVVEMADRETDRFVPVASAGFEPDHAQLRLDVSIDDLCRVFAAEFEVEGCYLLEREEALARVGAEPGCFASTLNGRGALAWNRHWLIVPLHDDRGDVMGFIWADDPDDRLIPSPRRLQALRLFANQAKTALDSAEQLAALGDANERQRAIIEASPVGIVVLDDKRTVRSWNPAAKLMYGYADEDVIGHEPPWISAGALEDFRRNVDSNMASGEIVQAAFTDLRADGTEIEVSTSSAPLRDSQGRVTGMLAMIADITDRVRAEEALRESSEMREAMIAASPVAIMALDRDGNVRSWNAAAEQMFGYTPREAIGSPPAFLEAQDLPGFRESLASVLAGQTLNGLERTRTRRDGTLIEVSINAAPLRDAAGSVTGVIAAIADMTSRNQAERDVARRNAELEALHATTLDLIERLDSADVLETIVERAGELLGTPHGYLYLVDPEADEMRVAVGVGMFDEHLGARLKRGEGLAGRVWAAGRTVSVDDYSTWADGISRYSASGFHAVAGVPIRRGAHIVGVLGIAYTSETRTFDDGELALLSRFGQLASLALEHAHLYAEARRELDERRTAEQALRKSQELYRAIVDNSTDIFALLDLEGRILYVSPAYERLLGHTAEEVVGQPAVIHIHPDDAGRVQRNLAARIAGEDIEPSSGTRIQHKDGHWLQIEGVATVVPNERGEPEMILSIVRDVTEERRRQEFLAKTQELYRTVVDSSRDLILLLDLEGKIEFASPSLREILGYEPDELVGKSSFELLHPDDVDAVRSLVVESLRGERSGGYVARVRHEDGRWIEMEGIPAPVNENGRTVAILGVVRDVSERLRADEERSQLEEQLRQSQKMEAIGQLAGGIAHDFNNLLTAITGYGDLALEKLDTASPVRRNVEEMRRAGERAAVLTRQLLAFSRKQVLQPKVVDLNDVVSGLEGMLARVLGEHVDLVTALDGDLGHTRADPGQIEQVVMNLAINARDAMPTGGRLTIATENVELDDLFVARHHGAVAGQYVMLSVADTGVGMDRETLDRVFDPFFTTKPPGHGTGLGLSTVYGIVKQTGGQIWAYAEPGNGATFKVYLPRVWERTAERGEVLPAVPLSGTETVLLVEDEGIVRDLVSEMLDTAGYRVLEAPSGDQALALAEAHDGPIDLLMTDVVMPGMSGQELAGRLLERRPGIRVLFTSGYAEDAVASHGVLAPGTAFVEKPFTAALLGQKLRGLLDRRDADADAAAA